MNVQQVSDFRSNEADQIVYAAKKLKRSSIKRKIFKAVYAGRAQIKTVNEISYKTKLSRKSVLNAGIKLVHEGLIHQTKKNNDIGYKKDSSYQAVWKKIDTFKKIKNTIKNTPTKTNPRATAPKAIVKIPTNLIKIKQITIDDISSFEKVRKIKNMKNEFTPIPENLFKKGILKILKENKVFKDWGGEKNDIYTTKLKIKNQRYHAALALKGPGHEVAKLTPRHMGRNGDQIQRLTSSSAQVFLVQYWKEIDQSVIDLMTELAKAKSATEGRRISFGIIDGEDSNRLIAAYPSAFKYKGTKHG